MIHVDRIERILQTVAVTPAVTEGRGGLSVILIAPPDGGKTRLMLRNLPRGARVINDFTYAALLSLINEPEPPRFIVVPDFNIAVSHKPAVVSLAMSILLPLLAEGITEIPGPDGNPLAIATLKKAKKRGIKFALITGMTPDMFFQKRGKWRDTGLLRRLHPIYYTYSKSTETMIQTSIRNGTDQVEYDKIEHTVPRGMHAIEIPELIGRKLETLSEVLTENQLIVAKKQQIEFAFSVHKSLRTYTRAAALLAGHESATLEDFHRTQDFASFVRYDRPERI